MARAFDRFMVDVEVGRNLKLGRLKPAERWVYVAGVLPIAAKSEVRGAMLVGSTPATDGDIARQADVPLATARAALRHLRELGMLDRDDALGTEWVHDFEEYNPEPKQDRTAKDRAKRYRERQAAKRDVTPASRRDDRDANGVRHGTVTPPEVEGGKEEEGTTSLRSVDARRRAAEPDDHEDELPGDLPAPLRPVAEHVHQRLAQLAKARGVAAPSLARVGTYVRDFPDHDHRQVAADVVDYWQHGAGAKTVRKDFGRVYLDRLKHTVARPSHLRAVDAGGRSTSTPGWVLAAHAADPNGGAA